MHESFERRARSVKQEEAAELLTPDIIHSRACQISGEAIAVIENAEEDSWEVNEFEAKIQVRLKHYPQTQETYRKMLQCLNEIIALQHDVEGNAAEIKRLGDLFEDLSYTTPEEE